MNDNPRIVLVDLSRNFGHHQTEFHRRYEEEGDCDVVYGYQTRRKGSLFERFSGWMFYELINALSDIEFMAQDGAAQIKHNTINDAGA